jgi:hypothetical protein
MQRCHAEMIQAADEAEAAHQDPALALRARILAQAAWVQDHPGIHKVMHESKVGMPFKKVMFTRITAAVQRCMDAGAAPPGDAAAIALDLRTAVTGMLSLRINEPDLPSPPFPRASRPVPLQARRTRGAGRGDDSPRRQSSPPSYLERHPQPEPQATLPEAS